MALNREFLGFDSGLISKTQVRKLRTASFKYLTESFTPDFQKANENDWIEDLSFEYENLGDGDQDTDSILIFYPNVIDYLDYIKPREKVEIGSRSLKDSYTELKRVEKQELEVIIAIENQRTNQMGLMD